MGIRASVVSAVKQCVEREVEDLGKAGCCRLCKWLAPRHVMVGDVLNFSVVSQLLQEVGEVVALTEAKFFAQAVSGGFHAAHAAVEQRRYLLA